MKCFKCNLYFDKSNYLILHLKHDHHLKPIDKYQCTDDCGRTYNSLNSYRKHLNAVHFNDPVPSVMINTPHMNQNVACSSGESFQIHEHEIVPVIDDTNSGCNELQKSKTANTLQLEAESLIMTLYSEPQVPRKIVQLVTESISSFFENAVIASIKDKLHTNFRLPENSEKTEVLEQIDNIIDSVENPFKDLSSEYRRFKMMQNNHKYTPPGTYTIGEVLLEKKNCGKETAKPVLVTGKVISLRVQLKAVLEIPGLLLEIKQYLQDLQSDNSKLRNFVQGDLWQQKSQNFGNKTVFPLFIYFDEYETGNPLGSHAGVNKLGAVYASIACMPPKYASTLQSILLVLLFFAQDRNDHGNKATFKPLLDELHLLRNEGVTIVTDSGEEIIYFSLGILLGDNLGFNSMLGLTESFSSNFYCRFCRVKKERCQTLCREDPNSLRTRSNYDKDFALNDPKQTGIKEFCIWNELEDFHMCDNQTVDLPHDFGEGIVIYVMSAVIDTLIFGLKLFTLDTLNFRIQVFDYGRLESSNKVRFITLKSAKEVRIKMSASEAFCFVRYFGFMVGDLVPEDNQFWHLYILLRRIIDLTTAPHTTYAQIDTLSDLISQHHELYRRLYPRKTLTPKFHFATHYPRVMRAVGPPTQYSSLRYESRHRLSKLTANVSCSRVNIIHTLAIKHQLQSCNFVHNSGWVQTIETGPSPNIDATTYNKYFRCVASQNSIQRVAWIESHGTRYEVGSVLILEKTSVNPVFGNVTDIFMVGDVPHFLVTPLPTCKFDSHFWGYEIIDGPSMDLQTSLVSLKTVADSRLCSLLLMKRGKTYVTTRYIL